MIVLQSPEHTAPLW